MVITGLGMGGAERQVIDLAQQLTIRGHAVTVIYLRGEIKINIENQNINIQKANFDKNPLIGFCELIKLIRSQKPDIIHSHMVHANIITRISRIFTNFPVLISTAHSTNEGGILPMIGYRLSDPLCDLTTNVSTEAVERYIRIKASPAQKIIKMHNGIDTKKFFQKSKSSKLKEEFIQFFNKKIFLSVGRLTEAKDHQTLIKAFKIATEINSNLVLLIAGEGDKRSEIEDLIKNLNLSSKVKLLGLRNDINELLNFCDAFVLSSAWEGLPLVVGEAMACGKPVVSTSCSGVSDYFDEKQWLSPIKDPQKLSENILKIANLSQEELTSISTNNIEKIKKEFCMENITNKWLEIYCRLSVAKEPLHK